MKKISFYGLLTAGLVLTLSACSSKDLYDEGKVEQVAKSSYAENFTKK